MSISSIVTGAALPDPTTIPQTVINPTRQLIITLPGEAVTLPTFLVYSGTGAPGISTEAEIQALQNANPQVGRSRVFSVDAQAGEKTYYVLPQSFGDPTFFVGGYEGGFFLGAAGVDVGGTLYNVWESDQEALGAMEVVVK